MQNAYNKMNAFKLYLVDNMLLAFGKVLEKFIFDTKIFERNRQFKNCGFDSDNLNKV